MSHSKKQFTFNIASGWLVQLVNVAVGVILLPYIISRLGAAGYGIYELARSAIVFFMFLQLGMGPTLVRFFTKSIAKRDMEEIRKISSTAQLLLSGLGLIIALLCLALIPFFLHFYEIPAELSGETTGLLVCMAASFFLNMTIIVPQGMVLGLNRYELSNGIEIVAQLLRMCLIFALFELVHPSIFFVGFSMLLAAVWRFVALFYCSIQGLKYAAIFSLKSVGLETVRSLLGFSSLTFLNSIAAAVALQAPALLIGKFLGQEAVAAFAPAMLISAAMAGILGHTARPLVPIASKDIEENGGRALGGWAVSMGRFIAFVGFGIALPLAVFGPEVMQLWLGDSLSWIWPVVVVMSTGIAISQIQAGNYFLALGGGDIRPTVYSQMVMAVVVFSGLIMGLAWFGWQLFEVALFIGLCILIRNTFYLAFAYSKQFSYSYPKYLWLVYVVPAFIAAGCVLMGWGLKYILYPHNIILLAFEGFAVLCSYAFLSWFILIPGQIKQKIIASVLMKLPHRKSV